MSDSHNSNNDIELAAELVSAYVSKNSLPAAALPSFIETVYAAFDRMRSGAQPQAEPEPQKPAVSVKKSVTEDFIVCLEDGKRFASIKRHLASAHGMTPEQYRGKWGLGKDYPMVAPAYAARRSALAKSIGLGQKPEDLPEAEDEETTGRGRRSRSG